MDDYEEIRLRVQLDEALEALDSITKLKPGEHNLEVAKSIAEEVTGHYKDTPENRNARALDIAFNYTPTDGVHHKNWVIDQMVRALLGSRYKQKIRDWCCGEDGEGTYKWNEGSKP